MLKEVDDVHQSGAKLQRRESKLVGVTHLEELLMDHQAKLLSDKNDHIIVGLDDALMQLQIESQKKYQVDTKKINDKKNQDKKAKLQQVKNTVTLDKLMQSNGEDPVARASLRFTDGNDLVNMMLGDQDKNFMAGSISQPEERRDPTVRPDLVIRETVSEENSSSLKTSMTGSDQTSELK